MSGGRVPLGRAFDSRQSKQQYVRRLFSTIADRYDLITPLLSFGLDRRWKRRTAALAAPRLSARALDLACGTGDLAFELASRGATAVGLDVTHRMLELASAKVTTRGSTSRARTPLAVPPAFVTGDMMSLPFADATFDVVTTGYGLRNVPDLSVSIAEIHRVLRPGGTFVSLDFNRPANAAVRTIFLAYLAAVGSALGWVLHRDPDTYRYIPASIRRYPGAQQVVGLLRSSGFADAEWHRVLGGLMAIHVARK